MQAATPPLSPRSRMISGWAVTFQTRSSECGFQYAVREVERSCRIDKHTKVWRLRGLGRLLVHVFPIYFGFRGGKGVVTSAAMMALIDWRVFLIVLLVFVITFAAKKIVSLGSVLGAAVYPVATFLVTFFFDYRMQFLSMVSDATLSYVIASTVFALLIGLTVIILHRANIKRLLAGEEKRISFSGPKEE